MGRGGGSGAGKRDASGRLVDSDSVKLRPGYREEYMGSGYGAAGGLGEDVDEDDEFDQVCF